METRLKLILIGIVIAIAGFTFAFSSADTDYVYYCMNTPTLYNLISAFPNLISGLILGIGGMTIAIIGNIYFKKSVLLEKTCHKCGQRIDDKAKYCPNCGFMQPIQSS